MEKFRLLLTLILIAIFITTNLQFSPQAQQTTINTGSPFINIIPILPKFPLNNDFDESPFTPINITVDDDAFHNSNSVQYTEWWYFDAELSNNYTLQFSIHVYNIISMSFITVNYNIYQYGQLIEEHRTMYQSSDFNLSEDTPNILLHDESLKMIGVYEPSQQKLYYHITYSIENSSMDLYYRGMTQGWKGKTTAGDWAVMLPKATVFGTLIVNNTRVNVHGIGYHDHNWNVTISAGLNFGWIWGKANTKTYTLTWADILTTWFKGDPLLVVNKENNGYYQIPLEDITFSITEIAFKDGMLIPYGFALTGRTDNITVDMDISVIDSDYTTVLGIINYWRYHVHSKGTITFNDHTEQIDDYDIAEFIRFRFY